MIGNLCRLMIEPPERPLFCKDHSFSCHMGYKRLVFPICSWSLNLFTRFTFKMTASYAAPYSDEEFEKLLQDVNDFPSSIDNPSLGLDFSALPSIDDIDTMTSLCKLPPPPPSTMIVPAIHTPPLKMMIYECTSTICRNR